MKRNYFPVRFYSCAGYEEFKAVVSEAVERGFKVIGTLPTADKATQYSVIALPSSKSEGNFTLAGVNPDG